jgi:excisionase family DNA binding protein
VVRSNADLVRDFMDDDPYLTAAEVAALFRVNPTTVARWVSAGRITGVRTPGGRDLRFQASEVRAKLRGGSDGEDESA